MKFGGTSVGSAERIRALSDLVKQRLPERPVVVVSALSGITDLLIRGAHFALERDPAADQVVKDVEARHQAVLAELFPTGKNRLVEHVHDIVSELRAFYSGVHNLGELTPRSLDAISGMGERLSCEIVAAALVARGVDAQAVDGRSIVITDESFGRAFPLEIGRAHV